MTTKKIEWNISTEDIEISVDLVAITISDAAGGRMTMSHGEFDDIADIIRKFRDNAASEGITIV